MLKEASPIISLKHIAGRGWMTALAMDLGVTRQTVSYWANGHGDPPKAVSIIFDLLGRTPVDKWPDSMARTRECILKAVEKEYADDRR